MEQQRNNGKSDEKDLSLVRWLEPFLIWGPPKWTINNLWKSPPPHQPRRKRHTWVRTEQITHHGTGENIITIDSNVVYSDARGDSEADSDHKVQITTWITVHEIVRTYVITLRIQKNGVWVGWRTCAIICWSKIERRALRCKQGTVRIFSNWFY